MGTTTTTKTTTTPTTTTTTPTTTTTTPTTTITTTTTTTTTPKTTTATTTKTTTTPNNVNNIILYIYNNYCIFCCECQWMVLSTWISERISSSLSVHSYLSWISASIWIKHNQQFTDSILANKPIFNQRQTSTLMLYLTSFIDIYVYNLFVQ